MAKQQQEISEDVRQAFGKLSVHGKTGSATSSSSQRTSSSRRAPAKTPPDLDSKSKSGDMSIKEFVLLFYPFRTIKSDFSKEDCVRDTEERAHKNVNELIHDIVDFVESVKIDGESENNTPSIIEKVLAAQKSDEFKEYNKYLKDIDLSVFTTSLDRSSKENTESHEIHATRNRAAFSEMYKKISEIATLEKTNLSKVSLRVVHTFLRHYFLYTEYAGMDTRSREQRVGMVAHDSLRNTLQTLFMLLGFPIVCNGSNVTEKLLCYADSVFDGDDISARSNVLSFVAKPDISVWTNPDVGKSGLTLPWNGRPCVVIEVYAGREEDKTDSTMKSVSSSGDSPFWTDDSGHNMELRSRECTTEGRMKEYIKAINHACPPLLRYAAKEKMVAQLGSQMITMLADNNMGESGGKIEDGYKTLGLYVHREKVYLNVALLPKVYLQQLDRPRKILSKIIPHFRYSPWYLDIRKPAHREALLLYIYYAIENF